MKCCDIVIKSWISLNSMFFTKKYDLEKNDNFVIFSIMYKQSFNQIFSRNVGSRGYVPLNGTTDHNITPRATK